MKPTSRRLRLGKWLGALSFLALAAVSPAGAGQNTPAPGESPVPETPAAVAEVVVIHPFRLRTEYRHDWMASRPEVSTGLLVVLKVNSKFVLPRDTAEPVLFAGDVTVQRLSQGYKSGYVVGIIPGKPDLSSAIVWFGRPQLPERVTAEIIAEEREIAVRAGIKPFTPEEIERATREGLEAEDLAELLAKYAADLVLKYSPDEKDLAETWRLPSIGG